MFCAAVDALHRVIAEEVSALDPLPPFRASIKDGYAVLSTGISHLFAIID